MEALHKFRYFYAYLDIRNELKLNTNTESPVSGMDSEAISERLLRLCQISCYEYTNTILFEDLQIDFFCSCRIVSLYGYHILIVMIL